MDWFREHVPKFPLRQRRTMPGDHCKLTAATRQSTLERLNVRETTFFRFLLILLSFCWFGGKYIHAKCFLRELYRRVHKGVGVFSNGWRRNSKAFWDRSPPWIHLTLSRSASGIDIYFEFCYFHFFSKRISPAWKRSKERWSFDRIILCMASRADTGWALKATTPNTSVGNFITDLATSRFQLWVLV